MKKFLVIIILLISVGAKAQYTPMSAFGYQMKYLKVDSGFALPMRDTSIGRGTTRPGLMVINTQDTLPYYFNGQRWKPVYVDSSGVIQLINTKVDSVTVNGNTLFYWIGGLGYGATLNKLDSIHVSSDSIFTCIGGTCTFQYTTSVGSGTVTSIMAGFGLTGDTITASGTLAVDTTIFHTSAYNNVTFAAISHTHSASDIISGTLPIVRGGTGLSGIGAAGQELRVAGSGTVLEYFTPVRTDSSSYHTIGQAPDSTYFTISKPDGTVDTVRFVMDSTGSGSSYTLPVASSSTLGGIKVGSGLSIDGSGVLSAGLPYTSYVAAITQSGTSAPVAVVSQNNTGFTFTYSYVSVGRYLLTCSGTAFATAHSYVMTQNQAFTTPVLFESTTGGTTQLNLFTRKTDGTNVDGSLNGEIEIRIYP